MTKYLSAIVALCSLTAHALPEGALDGVWHQKKKECEKGALPDGPPVTAYLTMTGKSRVYFAESGGCRMMETSTCEMNPREKATETSASVIISNRIGTVKGDPEQCPKDYKLMPGRAARVQIAPGAKELKFFILEYPDVSGLPNPCAGKGALVQTYERVI